MINTNHNVHKAIEKSHNITSITYSGEQKSKTSLFSARANYLEIKLKLHAFQESKPFNINTV